MPMPCNTNFFGEYRQVHPTSVWMRAICQKMTVIFKPDETSENESGESSAADSDESVDSIDLIYRS